MDCFRLVFHVFGKQGYKAELGSGDREEVSNGYNIHSKVSEQFSRGMYGTFSEAYEFAEGLSVEDLMHMSPPLFQVLLDVHVPCEAGLRCLCLAAWIQGWLLSCTHLLLHFLYPRTPHRLLWKILHIVGAPHHMTCDLRSRPSSESSESCRFGLHDRRCILGHGWRAQGNEAWWHTLAMASKCTIWARVGTGN